MKSGMAGDGSAMPRAGPICVLPMMSAMPVVKPMTTG